MSGCGRSEPLHVGLHPWPGYEPLLLARHFGWLPDAVHLHEGDSARNSIEGLKAGTLSAACLTLDEVLGVRVAGTPLTVILVMNESVGADAVLARPGIRTLTALKGKRIAVEKGAVGSLVLQKTLAAAGLAAHDIDKVNAAPSEQLPLWEAKQIDVAISYPPYSKQLIRAGAHPLYDSRAFPHTILDVLAVRNDRMRAHDTGLRGLVAGYLRALEHLRVNREDALRRIAAWRGTSFEETEAAYRGLHLPSGEENRRLLAPQGDLIRTARNLNELMTTSALLPEPDTLTNLTNAAYLPSDR